MLGDHVIWGKKQTLTIIFLYMAKLLDFISYQLLIGTLIKLCPSLNSSVKAIVMVLTHEVVVTIKTNICNGIVPGT